MTAVLLVHDVARPIDVTIELNKSLPAFGVSVGLVSVLDPSNIYAAFCGGMRSECFIIKFSYNFLINSCRNIK